MKLEGGENEDKDQSENYFRDPGWQLYINMNPAWTYSNLIVPGVSIYETKYDELFK